jgi:glutathione S-transferase
MPAFTDPRFQEAELLTRAVDNVFRKLIRFLVGRISLVRLQEMIRYIYVEETEKKLRRENPGRNVPLTKLALNTGLDTRTLVRVRKRLDLDEQQYRQQFLAELTPESAVVEAWAERVRTAADGRDCSVMAYGSEDAPFEQLVRSTIATRGITTRSLIERLVATNSVEHDRERRRLKLLVDTYSPYLSGDEPSIVNAAFSAISNLISTIEHNVAASQEDKLFQRQAWTFRLDPADLADFRRDLRAMLEEHEVVAKRRIEPWESTRYERGHVTAGVGLYYFEDL